jgi:hypothetical protein
MSKVSELLQDLSPEDIDALRAVLLPVKTVKKTRKQSKPKRSVKSSKPKKSIKSSKYEIPSLEVDTYDIPEVDNIDSNRPRPQKAKRICRRRPLELGERENKFLKMPEYKMHKEDVKIDKLLHKNRQIQPRGDRPHNLVKVKCMKCGDVFIVNTKMVPVDSETRKARFICNDCCISRR